MSNPIAHKHIILCVTGSIAAYKAADLASKLAQWGAVVDVLLTEGATHFITPLTFQSVTGRRAYTDEDLWGNEAHVIHVGLGHGTDLVVVAPATANTMAKLAHGLADNLVSVTALAARCPLVLAPAMDGEMFNHPATQVNVEILRGRGAFIVGPASGHLASGLTGVGRMVEPAEILGQIRYVLGRGGPLSGRKVVISAAGTQEPIDPVRAITNRSSGKQGYSLAQAALDLGADVVLVSGPTPLPAPVGAQRIDVTTAQEMLEAILPASERADALIMAAAVADFKPAEPAGQKIKKEGGIPQIRLENTVDILKAVAARKEKSGWPRVTIGFAAESQDLYENAVAKIHSKNLDLIVANDISAADAGFGVDNNRVTLIDPQGGLQELPLMSKAEVSEAIMDRLIVLLREKPELVIHITTRKDWQAAQESGEYRAESLESEGFIHCSRLDQAVSVGNRYFKGQNDLVLLWIDPQRVKADIHWDPVRDEIYPHIYGPLNIDAVKQVTTFAPDADGAFRRIDAAQ